MEGETQPAFEQRLDSLTTAFLERIDDCVRQLPELLTRYASEQPYQETVQEIRSLETVCDRRNRELSSLVSAATVEDLGIRLTWVHLHSGRVIELFTLLDTIANTAERFADELSAMRPPRRVDCLEGLHTMATHAVTAMGQLRTVVVEFIRTLCRPDHSIAVTDAVRNIRGLESESDAIRNDIVATAFREQPYTVPLLYRELALVLDTVLDTMEDVTDQLLLITGNESWIDIEPTGNR